MHSLLNQLKTTVLIMDGAMGTELQKQGLPFNTPSDLWTLERPDKVLEVHQAYVNAGAQVIYTNTFGSSRNRLKTFQLDDHIIEINTKAVELAKRAAQGKAYIAGCMSPIGSQEIPFKNLSDKEAQGIYEEQIRILIENKVDLIVIETLYDETEIKTATQAALKTIQHKIPLMISMTLNEKGSLPDGSNPLKIASYLEKSGVAIIGLNCSMGPELMFPVFQKIRKRIKGLLAVKPNRGMGKITPPLQAQQFSDWGNKFKKAGANLIGGCCGTTPLFIQQLRNTLSPMD